jgi:hypothetical protein
MEQPRNKKGTKRRSRRVDDSDMACSPIETVEYKDQAQLDEEARLARKMETKLMRQQEKALRRARPPAKVFKKKPLSKCSKILEEDFCLQTVYEEHEFSHAVQGNGSSNRCQAKLHTAWDYEDDSATEDGCWDDSNANDADNSYGAATYVATGAHSDHPTLLKDVTVATKAFTKPAGSTTAEESSAGDVQGCQTRGEWLLGRLISGTLDSHDVQTIAGVKRVAYDATADQDDWQNAEDAPSEASSLFGGCTTASVVLDDNNDQFIVLDEETMLNVMDAEEREKELAVQKQLDEWEVIDGFV